MKQLRAAFEGEYAGILKSGIIARLNPVLSPLVRVNLVCHQESEYLLDDACRIRL